MSALRFTKCATCHGSLQQEQSRLRRQSEARVCVRVATQLRFRGFVARRRSVRSGMHTRSPAASDRRPRRRRPGLADANTTRSSQSWIAPVQVYRQPDFNAYPELLATNWSLRVSLRISRLPRRGATPLALFIQLQRLSFRYRDHYPVDAVWLSDPGSADTDVLWPGDLSC